MHTTDHPTPDAPPIARCGCGCGAPVARRYAPGHDAKHKGALLRTIRDEATTPRRREAAVSAMLAAGWGRYVPVAVLREHPQRDRRGRRLVLLADAARFLVAPDGTHHGHAACQALTNAARAAGAVHPTTRLARPSFFRLVTPTDETRAALAASWDVCHVCIAQETPDEAIARETRHRRMATAPASSWDERALGPDPASQAPWQADAHPAGWVPMPEGATQNERRAWARMAASGAWQAA